MRGLQVFFVFLQVFLFLLQGNFSLVDLSLSAQAFLLSVYSEAKLAD